MATQLTERLVDSTALLHAVAARARLVELLTSCQVHQIDNGQLLSQLSVDNLLLLEVDADNSMRTWIRYLTGSNWRSSGWHRWSYSARPRPSWPRSTHSCPPGAYSVHPRTRPSSYAPYTSAPLKDAKRSALTGPESSRYRSPASTLEPRNSGFCYRSIACAWISRCTWWAQSPMLSQSTLLLP
mgnify:CR=1 FL=1